MFELRGINKKFDAVVALKDAHLQISPGEIRALLGSNGSGKSTMVKILSGLVKPNSGEITLEGKSVSIHSGRDARKLGIGVAYQDLSLVPNLSVLDNLLLGLEPTKSFGIIDRKKGREYAFLSLLDINCDENMLVKNMMPSQQSMLEVAKALALKPKLLLLDESTASLHHDEVDKLFSVLADLKSTNLATIIVTHRMNEIYRICDTCTVLRGGETVIEGNIKDIELSEVVFHMTGKYPDAMVRSAAKTQTGENREKVLSINNLELLPKVNDISLEAFKGEIVGIGGLEGQGQSEVIRALLGDVKRAGGEILYKGKAVNYSTPADAIKDEMGFVSGDRSKESIFPLRSVAENIYAAKATKGPLFGWLAKKQINDFASDAIKKYDIKAGGLNNPASSLSGGNQQKLIAGRWISLSPALLLLDDPTKGVDINARREIHQILKDCAKNGMTVIIVSSDNEELLDISDRIYIFYEGRVSAILSGDDRVEEKLVAAMMGLTGEYNQSEAKA